MNVHDWGALAIALIFAAAFLFLLGITICFGVNLLIFNFYNKKSIKHYSEAERLLKEYKRSKDMSVGSEVNFNLRKAEHYSKIADRYYDLLIKRKRQK